MDTSTGKYVQIYTDWANHYLQKGGHGHSITDLQKDVRDGVILAEVIQSVSGDVIDGILLNPSHDGEALENISACLEFLDRKGVNVQDIQPQDILEGNLKCILTLFYGLSRLKQKSRTVNNSANNPAARSASPATAVSPVINGSSSSLISSQNATRTQLPGATSTAELGSCSRLVTASNPSPAATVVNSSVLNIVSTHQKNNIYNCNSNGSISSNGNNGGNLIKSISNNCAGIVNDSGIVGSGCPRTGSFHEQKNNFIAPASSNCETSVASVACSLAGSQQQQQLQQQLQYSQQSNPVPVVSKQHSSIAAQPDLSQSTPGFNNKSHTFSAGSVPPVNATSNINTCPNTIVTGPSSQLVVTQNSSTDNTANSKCSITRGGESQLQPQQLPVQYHCQQTQKQQQQLQELHQQSKTNISSVSPVGGAPVQLNRTSCNFTPPSGDRSRPNSRCSHQVSNQNISRQLSEITESDYDYGYSCSSEVYQSITGAQLWSPSHTSRQSSSSVCSTPTRQPCRTVDNSAPVVPSYYLRSLSPPPVVDHYSTGGESRKQAKGISRLFAGRESRKKKSQAANSGSVSEGEASSSRYSVQPKSPLKAALGKAFGSKSQPPAAVSEIFDVTSRKGSQNRINKTKTTPTKSCTNSPDCGTPTAVNMSSQVQSQLPRRMPADQTHHPPPPHSAIPQPKSKISPNRAAAPVQGASGVAVPVAASVKSPAEVRRGIPQPSSRPKSPANFNSASNLSKMSKVPASSGKIPTSTRSKSPGSSLIANSSNVEKDESRKLRPAPTEHTKQKSAEAEQTINGSGKNDSISHIASPRKPASQHHQTAAQPQSAGTKQQQSENAPTAKSHLPTSGIRPPGSGASRPSVARSTSGQYNRLKYSHSGSLSNIAPKTQQTTDNEEVEKPASVAEKQVDKKSKANDSFPDPETVVSEELKDDEKLPNTEPEIKTDAAPKASIETTFHTSGDTTSTSSAIGSPPQEKNMTAGSKIASPPQKQYRPSGIVTRSGSAASRCGRPGKVYGATRVPATQNGNASDTYGYVTDSDVISACSSYVEGDQSDCVNVNNMQTPPVNSNLNNSSNVTCQVTPAGYVSEGGEASVVAPPPPARAALSPATVAPLRYHQHSQQLQQPQTTRVFKDGISAIRDCLQRSDIQLADSDSEGDVESVTSNISDLVNDLSSDISANITSPSDLSKSKSSVLNLTPNPPSPTKTLQHILHQQQQKEASIAQNISLISPGSDSAFKDSLSPLAGQKPAKKTAIVQPQIPNFSDKPPTSHQLLCEAIRKSQEDLLMYSSAESSPLMAQKKSADGRSNATIKRCPASKASITQPPHDLDKADLSSNETVLNKMDRKLTTDVLSPPNAGQQPLIGQIRGNVFRLSSVSSAVSEEHEDARSDDCQRHSGGSFQNSELTNSRESLTVLHSRNQMSAAASLIVSPGIGSSPAHGFLQHPQQRRHLSPSNRRQIPPQIESDIEWESTSINSTRTNSFVSTHDKSCFSDTEDFTVKPRDPHSSLNSRILANNPAMRRFLESRAAQGRDANSRNPSAGSDYLESSFALMDIRNLREKLANPHNIDTQSDYGMGSSTLSRSRSGRLNAKQEQEADNLLEKFSLLNSMSPGDHSMENIRSALNKQYANLPLTQELLNKTSGLAPGNSISPSSMSTASATGALTVDPNPKHRYSAISDINPRAHSSSLYNTPVLGMKSPRSGSSTVLYGGSQSSKGSSYLPPELTLNHVSLSNALGELANLGRDDHFLCGSNMSLNSASSFDSAHIESQTMQETIRRLKNELILSNEKVSRLTSHIICNAQTVASFEKTLASLNHKLSEMLLEGSESTANEIENLKNLIERLKMLQKTDLLSNSQKELRDPTAVSKSRDNHVRANSLDAASFLSSEPPIIEERGRESSGMNNSASVSASLEEGGSDKTVASDDLTVGSANESAASSTSPQLSSEKMHDKKVKKNWLRSTFKLGRKKSPGRIPIGGALSASDVEEGGVSTTSGSVPSSPFHTTAPPESGFPTPNSATASSGNSSSLPRMQPSIDSSLSIGGGKEDGSVLKQKLHENEKKLTETKLQYLSSAHQIDQMKDEMSLLKCELDMLRTENEKLTNQTTSSSRCSPSNSSATSSNCMACRHSSCESCSASDLQHSNSDLCLSVLLDNTISSANLHVLSANSHETNSLKIIRIKIKLGNPKDELEPQACSFYVGTVGITANTQWFMIDGALSKIFADYLSRIDNSNLGLSVESLKCWSAGKDLTRSIVMSGTEESLPENEVSPFNYFESDSVHGSAAIPGSTTSIDLTLKDHNDSCCDALVFETCIPKQHLQLYFNQWAEFKKLIFIGPPGTGKSYLSLKMAHHLVSEMGLNEDSKTIRHLNMDLEGISELRETVKQIIKNPPVTGPASENGKRNTTVIFIENMHSLGSQMSEALSILSNVKINMDVFVIATMTSQSNQSYPQLQKVFPRWVVLSNHNEPISGLVGRYLRRQLLEFENRNGGIRNMHLAHIIDWIPKVWKHVNRLIEKYNSAEVTLGPHLFLSCPIDPTLSQSWFNNLWNYSLAPYLMEAIREGLQLYGVKSGTHWEDPTSWVEETYPWSPSSVRNKQQSSVSSSPSRNSSCSTTNYNPSLIRIRKEDVGFDKVCRSLGIESSGTSYDNNFSISQ